MRVPERLVPLVDQGMIDEVVRPLMAGKEAQIWLVIAGGWPCVAKVYKEATERSFHNRADYVEGRRTRNSRSQRAMAKKSRFGREQIEEQWKSAEVDVIYRLRAAGVTVPEPYAFVDGVLLMQLIADESGEPAPRMVDLDFSEEDARWLMDALLREVIKMLLAGVVPRRPLGLQHPDRPVGAGDHRLPAGGGPGDEQQRPAAVRARRGQPGELPVALRPVVEGAAVRAGDLGPL